MSIDMVQRFVVQVDSLILLEQYLRLAMTTALNSCEEVAVSVVDRKMKYYELGLPSAFVGECVKKHFPVMLIDGWYATKPGEESRFVNLRFSPKVFLSNPCSLSSGPVERAIEHVKTLISTHGEEWGRDFRKDHGDGFNTFFNEDDGSVGLGFELRSCGSFPERLAISVVHICYGK